MERIFLKRKKRNKIHPLKNIVFYKYQRLSYRRCHSLPGLIDPRHNSCRQIKQPSNHHGIANREVAFGCTKTNAKTNGQFTTYRQSHPWFDCNHRHASAIDRNNSGADADADACEKNEPPAANVPLHPASSEITVPHRLFNFPSQQPYNPCHEAGLPRPYYLPELQAALSNARPLMQDVIKAIQQTLASPHHKTDAGLQLLLAKAEGLQHLPGNMKRTISVLGDIGVGRPFHVPF